MTAVEITLAEALDAEALEALKVLQDGRIAPSQVSHAQPVSGRQQLVQWAQKYVHKWQPILRLMDWDIEVEVGDVDDNHLAESTKEWRNRRGWITLPDNFLEKAHDRRIQLSGETDEMLVEHSVLHELLHILEEPECEHHQNEIDWAAGKDGNVLGAELRNSWRDYREWWINHVVRAMLSMDKGRPG